ncbi:ATP-binding protein [Streptomyces sp. NPDC020875]|uniref:ATP-binding protein n=1 Tax=Streptomyces sp. NPDC020875 TaxID=3154898 RepID=UPI0033F24D1F
MEAETSAPTVEFVHRFPADRQSVRPARLLALGVLGSWGVRQGSRAAWQAAQIVGELAANAVQHARIPGCDFELRLIFSGAILRIELSDPRSVRHPRLRLPDPDAESGRGLVVVEFFSSAWGVAPRAIGKTVWAELPVRPLKDGDQEGF